MRHAIAVALVGVSVCGCASLVPPPPAGAPPPPAGGPASPVAEAQATHEYRSAPAPPESAPGSSSAILAVAEFAAGYINWDAGTVSGDMRRLAAASVGQARSAMELAAGQTAGDYELRRGGIANRGLVEAIAPLGGQPGQYVVVTREQTTATATTAYQGLQPAWHVAIATVARLGPNRWAVSGWQPES
jgi:hypothetical protein